MPNCPLCGLPPKVVELHQDWYMHVCAKPAMFGVRVWWNNDGDWTGVPPAENNRRFGRKALAMVRRDD